MKGHYYFLKKHEREGSLFKRKTKGNYYFPIGALRWHTRGS